MEECSVIEEVVAEVDRQENPASLDIFLKLWLVNVKTQPSSSQQKDDQEGSVQDQAGAGHVPHHNVHYQVAWILKSPGQYCK